MKKNLVTKTLLLSALFSAVVFAGCNNGSQEPAVEEIAVTSVVPATKSENAIPVTQEVFEGVVLNKLATELPDLATAIVPVSTGSKSREAVTMDDLQKSFKEFQKAFEMDYSNEGGYIKGTWNGPVGEIDYEDAVKGLSTTINALKVSVDASYKVSETGATGKANGSARYSASSNLDLTKESTSIKSGKANVLYSLDVNNVNASMSPENMQALMNFDGDDADYAALVDTLETLGGLIKFYSGIETALYFEVEDNSKLYNGVIKATVNAVINYNLSKEALKDTVEKVTALVSKIQKNKVTEDDLAALNSLVSLNVNLSVYDTNGEKLFSVVDAKKLEDAYTQIDELVEKF